MTNDVARVGRPPGPHDDTLRRLLAAAVPLFIAEGGAALTPTRLHAETGIARATIYRNWPEPADLIEMMLRQATEYVAVGASAGSFGDDLAAAVGTVLDRFDRRPIRALFAASVEHGRHADRVADAGQALIAALLAPIAAVVEAAVDVGTLTGSVDELVSELAGPLVLDLVVLGRAVTPEQGQRLVDRFLDRHLNSP